MFFSERSTSAVVIILYSEENFLCNLLRVSSVRDIVGTIINTLLGFFSDMKASMIKLFPKLVGALIARFSPLNSLFKINDCSRCNVIGLANPTSTLNRS